MECARRIAVRAGSETHHVVNANILGRLGADGYAFSKIDPVPTPDNDKKTVSLTFFIEPGNRVYVRHINFNNTTAINDETLRREMRQLEGGWLSNSAIERSKAGIDE